MPADENGAPNGQESGSQLRDKLEAALAENKAFRAEFAKAVGVDSAVLAEVAPDQFVARAAEIQAQRQAEKDALLAEALKDRGLSGDDLNAALAQLTKGEAPKVEAPAPNPFASTGSLGGTPPGKTPDNSLFGQSRIEAAIAERRNK